MQNTRMSMIILSAENPLFRIKRMYKTIIFYGESQYLSVENYILRDFCVDRQSVIDFRVGVVRSSGKDDSSVSGFVQKLDRLLPLCVSYLLCMQQVLSMLCVLRNKSRFLTVRIFLPVLQLVCKQWFLRF